MKQNWQGCKIFQGLEAELITEEDTAKLKDLRLMFDESVSNFELASEGNRLKAS